MAKKKKRRLRIDRVIIALLVVCVLIFGLIQVVSFGVSLFKGKPEPTPKEPETTKTPTAVVVIDPGHGGADGGAVNGETYEKDVVLTTALALQGILEEHNIKVVYTRTTDIEIDENKEEDLRKRAKLTVDENADFFVSIHVNDYADDPKISGFEVYKKDEASDKLATAVNQAIGDLNYADNRGIHDGNGFMVLRESEVPSILIEIGYIQGDYDTLSKKEELQKIGEAIAKGILAAYE